MFTQLRNVNSPSIVHVDSPHGGAKEKQFEAKQFKFVISPVPSNHQAFLEEIHQVFSSTALSQSVLQITGQDAAAGASWLTYSLRTKKRGT